MADPVTVPTEASVAAFIHAVEPQAKREDAKVLDALFRRVTGEEPRMWAPRSSVTRIPLPLRQRA